MKGNRIHVPPSEEDEDGGVKLAVCEEARAETECSDLQNSQIKSTLHKEQVMAKQEQEVEHKEQQKPKSQVST